MQNRKVPSPMVIWHDVAMQNRKPDTAEQVVRRWMEGILKKGIPKQVEICIPKNVTNGQIKDVFVKYLKDNPKDRNYPAASLLIHSIQKAWPCKYENVVK